MNSIDVLINGKLYKIGCGEEETAEVKQYAALLDRRIVSLKKENPTSFMSLSQETLFLVEAISLIAELKESKEQQASIADAEIEELNQKIKKLTKTVESLQKVVKNI
ncbi:MAG: cell division protein ZapA [Alphaproteobacteria bacterium]|nr:cell division protein ZapA [Alphaproteobacteria bacterium]